MGRARKSGEADCCPEESAALVHHSRISSARALTLGGMAYGDNNVAACWRGGQGLLYVAQIGHAEPGVQSQ